MVEADSNSLGSEIGLPEDQLYKYGRSSRVSQQHHNPLERDYNILNKRIAALQKQIGEKELEAARKMHEMKNILRQEQLQLIRISEEMTREKKRNLALQMTIDQDPCWTSNCLAECRGDFDDLRET